MSDMIDKRLSLTRVSASLPSTEGSGLVPKALGRASRRLNR